MAEYWGIIATAPSGSTAAMELVSGRDAATTRVTELVESDHTVRLFACKQVEFELVTCVIMHIVDGHS